MIDNEQLINIRLMYPQTYKNSIQDLQNFQVNIPGGSTLPLPQLASIQLKKGVAQVNRENLKSMGVVTARLDHRDLGSTLAEIQQKLAKKC